MFSALANSSGEPDLARAPVSVLRPPSSDLRPPPPASLFPIIHEDDELLVINKPAGLVCHPTKTDEYSSLIGRVRLYLGPDAQPQLINRLDRETSGVTVVVRNLSVARQLRRLWEERRVQKEYLAIVHGRLSQTHGTIDAPLGRDEHSLVAIKDCVRSDGAPAQTEYWVEKFLGRRPFTLLRVVPATGRKHQIRIHLAHIGHPIVGDKLYGGDESLYLAFVEGRLTEAQRQTLVLPYHALHASRLAFQWHATEQIFVAPPEPWFGSFAALEGNQ